MLSKKGLSGVITTVLIILLAIAAVMIVWQVIKPAIESTASDITLSCIDVDLDAEVISCADGIAEVRLIRNKGNLNNISVLLADDTETLVSRQVDITDTANWPIELGFKIINVPATANTAILADGVEITKVSIGAFVKKDDGSAYNCGVVAEKTLATPITCTITP